MAVRMVVVIADVGGLTAAAATALQLVAPRQDMA